MLQIVSHNATSITKDKKNKDNVHDLFAVLVAEELVGRLRFFGLVVHLLFLHVCEEKSQPVSPFKIHAIFEVVPTESMKAEV